MSRIFGLSRDDAQDGERKLSGELADMPKYTWQTAVKTVCVVA